MSNLFAFVRMNLFSRKSLWAWLDDPFPKPMEYPLQLPLFAFKTNLDSIDRAFKRAKVASKAAIKGLRETNPPLFDSVHLGVYLFPKVLSYLW
jgi:hypothetical protein